MKKRKIILVISTTLFLTISLTSISLYCPNNIVYTQAYDTIPSPKEGKIDEAEYNDCLYYLYDDGTAELFRYNNNEKYVTIPSKIIKNDKEYKITGIRSGAFSFYYNYLNPIKLEDVKIEEGLQYIEDRAFSFCKYLKKVALPDSLLNISSYAFYNCNNLKNIELPKNLRSIGDYVFSGCSLKNITLPDSLERLGLSSFNVSNLKIPASISQITSSNGESLMSVDIDDKNPYFKKRDGILYSNDMTTIYFADRTLSGTITLPKTVTTLSDYCFYGCSVLSEINLNESIKVIPNYCFSHCYSLKSIKLPKSIESLGENSFEYCNNLKDINLNEGLKSLGRKCFYHCSSVESIIIPKSVEYVSELSLAWCENLEYIEFQNGHVTLGYLFEFPEQWYSPNVIRFKDTDGTNIPLGGYDGTGKHYLKVSLIGRDCKETLFFNSLRNISKDILLKDLDGYLLYDSKNNCLVNNVKITNDTKFEIKKYEELNAVNINNYLYTLDTKNKTASLIGFLKNDSIVNIPESVKTIGDRAFYCCSALNNIVLPEGISKIGEQAFSKCSNFSELTIPSSVTEIGNSAFSDNSRLKVTNIKAPLKNLSDEMFSNCTNLSSVTLPNSLQKIGNSTFNKCISLNNIDLPSSLEEICENAFNSCGFSNIDFSNNLSIIEPNAFYNCNKLTYVKFPVSIKSISNTAFNSCQKIKQVSLPASLKDYCPNLLKQIYYLNNISIYDTLDKNELQEVLGDKYCYISIDDEDYKAIQAVKKNSTLEYMINLNMIYMKGKINSL